MKTLVRFLFVSLWLPAVAYPQNWLTQDSNFPANVKVNNFSVVNDRVCWASGYISPGNTVPYAGYIRTTDGGDSWVCDTIPGAETGYFAQILALDADTAFAAIYDLSPAISKGVYKTTDGGSSWTRQEVLNFSFYGPGYIHFFDAQNGVVIGDPDLETYTTTDGGRAWNPVAMPAAPSDEFTWAGGAGITGVGDRVWFSTGQRTFRSTDRGYTWTASTPEPAYSSWYPAIAFQDSSVGILSLWGFGSSYLYRRTEDGGVTWNPLSDPVIDNIAPMNICHVPGTSEIYLVAGGVVEGRTGVAVTFNAGLAWGLVDASRMIAIGFASDSVGWGGDWVSNEVRKYVGPPLAPPSAVDESGMPEQFALGQNYPNPFNPTTMIQFALPERVHVTLTVFNALGQQVATLAEGEREAGYHEVNFDASNLASGVYLYRLGAGDFVQTRKLIVLR